MVTHKLHTRASNEMLLHPLFIAAQAGDKVSYNTLLTHVGRIAEGYCRRKAGDAPDIEDIVQDILISVHKALHTYSPERPCMPWLAALMYYRMQDYLRAHYADLKKKQAIFSDADIFMADHVTEEAGGNEYIDEAMRQLPEKQRRVLQAMYTQDLSVAETSVKLDMSVSAVKVTAHRAYKKMRQLLEYKREEV